MKEYIYPAGITGCHLGWLMHFLDSKVNIEYIDDRREETSLKAFAHSNKNGKIHFALSNLSENYTQKLIDMKRRLQAFNLIYDQNSLEGYIQQAIKKMKEFVGDTKAVIMICERLGGGKHNGFLHKELLSKGIKLILLCTHFSIYEKFKKYNSKQCLVVYWLGVYLDRIDFGEILLENSDFGLKHRSIIHIGHCLGDYTGLVGERDHIKAVCVFNKRHLKGAGKEYIPSGYLGFDVMLEKINSLRGGGANSVLIAPYDIKELQLMSTMIKRILTKYRVILRQRYEFLDAPEYVDLLKTFVGDLCIDASESFSVSSYKESFCLICGKTTTKFTYPLLSEKPVIVLPHDGVHPSFGGLEISGLLGINMKSYEEAEVSILMSLDNIKNDLKNWSEKIQRYRKENIYNFGSASKWLAEYLIKEYHLKD